MWNLGWREEKRAREREMVDRAAWSVLMRNG